MPGKSVNEKKDEYDEKNYHDRDIGNVDYSLFDFYDYFDYTFDV